MHCGGSPSGGTHIGWWARRSGPPPKSVAPAGYRTGKRKGQKKVLSLTNGRGRVRAVVTVARHCGPPVGWSQIGDVGERAGRHQDHESGAEAHQGGFQKGSWRVLPKEPAGGLQTAAWSPQGAAWIPVAFHEAITTREHPLGIAGGYPICAAG